MRMLRHSYQGLAIGQTPNIDHDYDDDDDDDYEDKCDDDDFHAQAFIPGACYRSNTQYCPTLLAR